MGAGLQVGVGRSTDVLTGSGRGSEAGASTLLGQAEAEERVLLYRAYMRAVFGGCHLPWQNVSLREGGSLVGEMEETTSFVAGDVLQIGLLL